MYSSGELFQRSREGYFGVHFPSSDLQSNEGNKYQYNTRVSTETVCYQSTYIILFLTRHSEYIKNDEL